MRRHGIHVFRHTQTARSFFAPTYSATGQEEGENLEGTLRCGLTKEDFWPCFVRIKSYAEREGYAAWRSIQRDNKNVQDYVKIAHKEIVQHCARSSTDSSHRDSERHLTAVFYGEWHGSMKS